jgi:hypothetical protein
MKEGCNAEKSKTASWLREELGADDCGRLQGYLTAFFCNQICHEIPMV